MQLIRLIRRLVVSERHCPLCALFGASFVEQSKLLESKQLTSCLHLTQCHLVCCALCKPIHIHWDCFWFPFSCKLIAPNKPHTLMHKELFPRFLKICSDKHLQLTKSGPVCADCELSSPGRPAQRPPAIVLGECGLHDSCTDVFICLCASQAASNSSSQKREKGVRDMLLTIR